MEIYRKPLKSMKYDESPQMTRNQPGIEQRFLKRHPQKSKPTSIKI